MPEFSNCKALDSISLPSTVEYLSDLIERLIKEYMTGKDIDPMSYNSNSNQ